MYLDRKQLKEIKKDVIEQLESRIETNNLYIKNWKYVGDDIYEGNENMYLDGKISAKERREFSKDKFTITNTGKIIFMIHDNNEIEFSCICEIMDEYDDIDNVFIPLNI